MCERWESNTTYLIHKANSVSLSHGSNRFERPNPNPNPYCSIVGYALTKVGHHNTSQPMTGKGADGDRARARGQMLL